MSLSIGFDPIAFLTSLFAVWFAYSESKKNNTILVKITRCQWSGRQAYDENRAQGFVEFSVLIHNRGITLHDPMLSLGFSEKGGFGWVNLPLRRMDEKTGEHSEFSRGMIAEFGLKSYEMDTHFCMMLEKLEDMTGQRACLNLYSQGYLAKKFYVGRLPDRLAGKWNSWAIRVNQHFDQRIDEHRVKQGRVLPRDLPNLSLQIQGFIQAVKREVSRKAEENR